MSMKIPVGIENFAELRDNNYYYIDKTFFIKELLSQPFKANLVTRPRRFGKTLTVCCKIKIPKVANQKWRKLHLHFGESCKAPYLCIK